MTDPREKIVAAIANAETLVPASPGGAAAAGESPEAEDEAAFGDAGPAPEDVDWDTIRDCALEPQNDLGNSRRLRRRHGSDLLHIQNVGYFAWDGRRWREDVDGKRARPLAHATAEAIAAEYLRRRGLVAPKGAKLRAAPQLKYWAHVEGEFRVVHEGPALIAATQGPDGIFTGVRLTFIEQLWINPRAAAALDAHGSVVAQAHLFEVAAA